MTKAEIVQNLLNARQITPEQAVILLSPEPQVWGHPFIANPFPDDITPNPIWQWFPEYGPQYVTHPYPITKFSTE